MVNVNDKKQITILLRKLAFDTIQMYPLCKTKRDKVRKKNQCLTCYPNQPERSKREDLLKCKMRCSEHCGNTVRDK
jgi:hypothetical protein